MKRRAQSSMEYITIVGFVFVLLVPMLVIYYDYRGDTTDAINTNHAFKIAKNIADQAETIFYLGEPSRTILKLNFPDRIQNITLQNFEVVFIVRTTNGDDHIVVPTTVNITGTLSSTIGVHHIKIESKGDFVEISED